MKDIQVQYFSIDHLKPYQVPGREIDWDLVDALAKRFKEAPLSFKEGRPLIISPNGGDKYDIIDGNHRYHGAKKAGINEVPCLMHDKDIDKESVSISYNEDQKFVNNLGFWNYLWYIKAKKEKGDKLSDISHKLGWSVDKTKWYSTLLGKIGDTTLKMCHQAEKNNVTNKGDTVTFSEGWFRKSGLYSLSEESQLKFFNWLKLKNFKVAKSLQDREVNELKGVEDQLEVLEAQLSNEIEDFKNQYNKIKLAIESREYTTHRLETLIAKLNEGAKNKALFGYDSLETLKTFADGSVDCVVTDPPWGVGFKSARNTENPDYDPKLDDIEEYLKEVFAELKRVTKENSHIYVFYPTIHHGKFLEMLSEHFEVSPIPLVWVKGNHTPCDFESRYASKYETIFFCKNPRARKLNNPVSPDVLQFSGARDRWHDSQKPTELLEYLIKNSTGTGETVLDCFAGSGSTLLAAKNTNRYFIGIEKEESYESKFKRALNEMAK